jgi:hypothetical protein
MKRLELSRFALAFGAASALLAGCGSQPPIGTPGAMLQSRATATHADHDGSWMLPDAKGRSLLYVSEQYMGITFVYTYPEGKLVGGISIPGSPDYLGGLCSNAAGDVFITAETGIYEYPHGRARAIAVLGDPYGPAYGCSIDSTTGNLAAISGSAVAIYRPAVRDRWHLPELFSLNPDVSFGGYDGTGNLFVDGRLSGSQNFFIELPKGKSKFESITLNKSFERPGNIEWDGKYLDIGDQDNLLIRKFVMNGTQGKQVGLVTLNGPAEVEQFWIQDNAVIGPAYSNGYYIGFWMYPRGGSAKKTIQQSEAYGATVSLARSFGSETRDR